MLPELLDHDRTLERIEVWVCPECGYWRKNYETGVHMEYKGIGPGKRHELVSELYVLERSKG